MDPTDIRIDELLPHRNRMRLVETVIELDDHHAVTCAVVSETWPLFSGTAVHAIVLIELVAQTAGINNGWVRVREEGPDVDKRGWIVGIPEAVLHVPDVMPRTTLITRAENRFAYDGFREIAGRVETADRVLAEVTLLLLRSDPSAS